MFTLSVVNLGVGVGVYTLSVVDLGGCTPYQWWRGVHPISVYNNTDFMFTDVHHAFKDMNYRRGKITLIFYNKFCFNFQANLGFHRHKL